MGELVAAAVGVAAYGVFGCAGSGERGGVGVVDADFGDLRLGVQYRGQAGDEVVRGEESPPVVSQ